MCDTLLALNTLFYFDTARLVCGGSGGGGSGGGGGGGGNPDDIDPRTFQQWIVVYLGLVYVAFEVNRRCARLVGALSQARCRKGGKA